MRADDVDQAMQRLLVTLDSYSLWKPDYTPLLHPIVGDMAQPLSGCPKKLLIIWRIVSMASATWAHLLTRSATAMITGPSVGKHVFGTDNFLVPLIVEQSVRKYVSRIDAARVERSTINTVAMPVVG